MDFTELIKNRESIRNYDPDRPVPREVLERILEAGRLAPTASNIQPFRFLVVSSPEMLGKVRACYHREWFKEAPHILIVVGFRDHAWKRSDGYNSIETDMAIAMDHLILAAENEGVGTCWIANYDPEILAKALGLKGNHVVFSITPLGYQKPGFKKDGNKKRKALNDIAEYL